MSIFELPTTVEQADEETSSPGFDPRAIQIAGVVGAALVALGLLVSNAARPDADPRPALTSKLSPGAAAVEKAEDAPPVSPVPAPAAPVPAEADQPVAEESEAATEQEAPAADDADWSSDGKHDGHRGKGHGRWR